MATVLVKPGLVKGRAIHKESSSSASLLGQSGTDYYIKMMESRYDFFSPTEEVTGDGDVGPVFENSLLLYANVMLAGAMVANQAIGIRNLVAETSGIATKNPLNGSASPVLHTFNLGGGGSNSLERLQFYFFIERILIRWSRTGRFVGVRMVGKMTGMTADAILDIENQTADP